MADNLKTGPEIIDDMIKEPTLDEMMRRDPATLSDADLRRIVELEREQRAIFIKGKVEKET